MIPVYQTMTVGNDGCGNCFAACVASILELPLRAVCQALPGDKAFWGPWREWLADRGLQIQEYRGEISPKGWAIASGPGGRVYPEGHDLAGAPILHSAVAFNGEVLHDPFPGGKGLEAIEWFFALEPIA